MNKQQKAALRHLTGNRLSDEEFADLTHYIETYLSVPQTLSQDLRRIVHMNGKIVRSGAEVIIAFKIGDKLYPATKHNCELMDTYLHTGEKNYLNDLENEVGF